MGRCLEMGRGSILRVPFGTSLYYLTTTLRLGGNSIQLVPTHVNLTALEMIFDCFPYEWRDIPGVRLKQIVIFVETGLKQIVIFVETGSLLESIRKRTSSSGQHDGGGSGRFGVFFCSCFMLNRNVADHLVLHTQHGDVKHYV